MYSYPPFRGDCRYLQFIRLLDNFSRLDNIAENKTVTNMTFQEGGQFDDLELGYELWA